MEEDNPAKGIAIGCIISIFAWAFIIGIASRLG